MINTSESEKEFLERKLSEFRINDFEKQRFLTLYTPDELKIAIEVTERKPRDNPSIFLRTALHKGWKPFKAIPKPLPAHVETKLYIEKITNDSELCKTQKNLEVERQHMIKLKTEMFKIRESKKSAKFSNW